MKDHLKAVGYNMEKPEIMEAFDNYFRNPTDPKNAFAVIAIQQAKEHVSKVQKEAADAVNKAKEAQEKAMFETKWGQGILEKAAKRPVTEQTQANNAGARVPGQQQEAPAMSPTQAMQQQLMGPGASALSGMNCDPQLQSLLSTTTGELLNRALNLAKARDQAVLAETADGSMSAKAFQRMWCHARTDQPLTTKQGADGGVFTGTPISGINTTFAGQATFGEIAEDLARSGRYKDMCAASVLRCDGKTFKHPVTGIEFPVNELLSLGGIENQVFAPGVITANLLSVGEGMDLPWDNRTKIADYDRPTAKAGRR